MDLFTLKHWLSFQEHPSNLVELAKYILHSSLNMVSLHDMTRLSEKIGSVRETKEVDFRVLFTPAKLQLHSKLKDFTGCCLKK